MEDAFLCKFGDGVFKISIRRAMTAESMTSFPVVDSDTAVSSMFPTNQIVASGLPIAFSPFSDPLTGPS